MHAQGRSTTHGDAARDLLGHVAMLELVRPVIGRAAEPYPVGVRTLDALHLASMQFLLEQGVDLRLASYDLRLSQAAEALGIESYPLPR